MAGMNRLMHKNTQVKKILCEKPANWSLYDGDNFIELGLLFGKITKHVVYRDPARFSKTLVLDFEGEENTCWYFDDAAREGIPRYYDWNLWCCVLASARNRYFSFNLKGIDK